MPTTFATLIKPKDSAEELKKKVSRTVANGPNEVQKIGPNHYMHNTVDQKLLYWHGDGKHGLKSTHSISSFDRDKNNKWYHSMTNKVDQSRPTKHIYQNMLHVLDTQGEVRSDPSQSPGGVNLWKNIHKYIPGIYSHIQDKKPSQKLNDFGDAGLYNTPSQLSIKK